MATIGVISISRTLGAGAEEVGRVVVERLGFRYVDDEIIVQAAEAAGVSPKAVVEAEKTPGLVTRILEGMGRIPPVAEGGYLVMAQQFTPEYESLIERVVRETASQGDVVIMAHGASIPLAGMDGLLRVMITAPEGVRASRLAEDTGREVAQALKSVRDSDSQRRAYLRRFYQVREELPTHYDLVINTESIGIDSAVGLIVAAARPG